MNIPIRDLKTGTKVRLRHELSGTSLANGQYGTEMLVFRGITYLSGTVFEVIESRSFLAEHWVKLSMDSPNATGYLKFSGSEFSSLFEVV